MNNYKFIIKQSNFNQIETNVNVNNNINVSINYYSLFSKNSIKSFLINKKDIISCKLKCRYFFNTRDIIIFTLVTAIFLTTIFQTIIYTSYNINNFLIIYLLFLFIFSFNKINQVIEIKTQDTNYYIPIAKVTSKVNINDLYKDINTLN